MRKNILITSIFMLMLSSSVVFGLSTKFDIAAHFSLGGFKGFQNNPAIGPGEFGSTGAVSRDMSLNIFSIGGGVSWDWIFIENDNSKYYGMGPSLYVNISVYNQGFSSDILMGDPDQTIFEPGGGQTNGPFVAMLSSTVIQIAPLYRFYPTRDISIGVGPVINIISHNGNYVDSDYYNGTDISGNPTGVAASNYYIQPMLGENIYLSAMIDVQVTKFFGDFGITGGLALHSIFLPFSVGIEGNFGVRYRFTP